MTAVELPGADLLRAFPDLRRIPNLVHHAADAVIIEGRTRGTQHADRAGIPSRGRVMDIEGVIVFRFRGDTLIDETVYYDHAAVAEQLGAGE
jgi:ketosteroid isomerase-like protein